MKGFQIALYCTSLLSNCKFIITPMYFVLLMHLFPLSLFIHFTFVYQNWNMNVKTFFLYIFHFFLLRYKCAFPSKLHFQVTLFWHRYSGLEGIWDKEICKDVCFFCHLVQQNIFSYLFRLKLHWLENCLRAWISYKRV